MTKPELDKLIRENFSKHLESSADEFHRVEQIYMNDSKMTKFEAAKIWYALYKGAAKKRYEEFTAPLSDGEIDECCERLNHKRDVAELRECLNEAVHNECNFCRTVNKHGTYGKCEHLLESGECDNLRGVRCIVHRWRKALDATKGAENETK